MRLRTLAASTALLVGAGLTAPALAQAVTPPPTTLYVNSATSAHCSDSGTGTAAEPFCTIQAAADVVTAGQTVLVEPGAGNYTSETDITVSGTPSAPIIFKADLSQVDVAVYGTMQHAFTVTGAHDVAIEGFSVGATTGESVLVSGSSDITLDGLRITANYGGGSPIRVTGGSSDVTIVRDTVAAPHGSGIVVDSGPTANSGDVITTDEVFESSGPGILVQGTKGVAVTNNTVDRACLYGIAVTGGSTGASVQNNVVEYTTPPSSSSQCAPSAATAAGMSFDAQSIAGSVENYNVDYPGNYPAAPYLWSGTAYTTAAALTAQTGQGATDVNAEALQGIGAVVPFDLVENSPAIDSANSAAPGEQSTDLFGRSRVDDPLVPDTGVGTAADVDRGAVEFQDPIQLGQVSVISDGHPVSTVPIGAPLTFSLDGTDPWGGTLTYVFDFGDGATTTNTTGTATHTYTSAGDYSVEVDVTSTEGGAAGSGTSIVAGPDVPRAANFTAEADGPLTVLVDASGSTDPWGAYEYIFGFGDGTSGTSGSSITATHTYAHMGRYTITVTMVDQFGGVSSSSSFLTAVGFSAGGCGNLIQPGPSSGAPGGPAVDPVPGVAGVCPVAVGSGTADPAGSGTADAATAAEPANTPAISAGGGNGTPAGELFRRFIARSPVVDRILTR